MYILASHSPRRKELMKQIVSEFFCVDSDIDESTSLNLLPLEACKDISKRKALAVRNKYPEDVIISADTIVTLDDLIIGKPKNEKDALRILKLLNNKTHQVITAYTIIKSDKILTNYVITDVTFNDNNDRLLQSYIESGSPLDKAGAYGIQDNDKYPIISGYKGSLENVIGFPTKEIKADLKKIESMN